MKLAFAIATITALQQAAVIRADCFGFGSNYRDNFRISSLCSFDVGHGMDRRSRESNTISSGDANVTTTTSRYDMAFWKKDDKDSTLQCYGDITWEQISISTSDLNGSTFEELSGNFPTRVNGNVTVADGVPLSSPGLYFVKGGLMEKWINSDGNVTITKVEGDITDLCEVLGSSPAPTVTPPDNVIIFPTTMWAPTGTATFPGSGQPTPPTTEAPSSGQMAAVTIIPGIAAVILNYFFS